MPPRCRSLPTDRTSATTLVAAATALVLLAACPGPGDRQPQATPSPSPVRGGVIDIGIVGEPATLDPYSPSASDLTYALVRPVFPMPYRLLPDGRIEPDLAESLEVSGRGVRLMLKPARWSDGRRVTARDVIASIERARPPSGLAGLRGRVVARRVVQLRGTVGDWEERLASGAFVLPRGRVRNGSVAGGPFRFARYEPGWRASYVPNPRWEGGERPLLDRLNVSFVQSTELLIRLLDRERLDVAAIPSTVNLSERLDELGIAHDERLGWESIALEFDTASLSRVSWTAVARRIDRTTLADSFVRAGGRVSDTLQPAPDDASGFWARVEQRAAGNLPDALTIAAPEGDEMLGLLQRAVQLDLQRRGMTVEVLTTPWASHYAGTAEDRPGDAALLRVAGAPGASGRTDSLRDGMLPIAHVVSVVAWRQGVHGMRAFGTLDGPLWDAQRWWKDPEI